MTDTTFQPSCSICSISWLSELTSGRGQKKMLFLIKYYNSSHTPLHAQLSNWLSIQDNKKGTKVNNGCDYMMIYYCFSVGKTATSFIIHHVQLKRRNTKGCKSIHYSRLPLGDITSHVGVQSYQAPQPT